MISVFFLIDFFSWYSEIFDGEGEPASVDNVGSHFVVLDAAAVVQP